MNLILIKFKKMGTMIEKNYKYFVNDMTETIEEIAK